jgi:hypothetical protein
MLKNTKSLIPSSLIKNAVCLGKEKTYSKKLRTKILIMNFVHYTHCDKVREQNCYYCRTLQGNMKIIFY